MINTGIIFLGFIFMVLGVFMMLYPHKAVGLAKKLKSILINKVNYLER